MVEPPRHIVAATAFVMDADGRVLLVRVAERGWEMPGGQVEAGEDLLDAVAREVEEETGCHVAVERLIGLYSRLTPPEIVLHLFGCRYLGGEVRAREDGVPEVGWFSPEEARRLVTNPPSAHRLADALAGRNGVVFRAYRVRPYETLLERSL